MEELIVRSSWVGISGAVEGHFCSIEHSGVGWVDGQTCVGWGI